MKLYHTSPEAITNITSSYDNEFQGALFFSSTPYFMSGASKFVYQIDISEDQVLEVCDLDYNQDIIDEIKERFNVFFDIDIDDDDAYDYLLEDLSVWDTMSGREECADFDWFIQGMQAKAAKKENYVAVEAEDEQGTVFIINMINKESLLKDVTAEFLGA
jgi:hypothetical protein